MIIPDFSTPSRECFLSIDKMGNIIKEGDILTSTHNSLNGIGHVSKTYTVSKYKNNLVVALNPSHLHDWYVRAHCVII